MQRPLKIISRDFVLTDAVESEIRRKAAALDRYYERLSGCEVTVHGTAIKHHRKGGPFVVAIKLTVPGKELAIDHQPKEQLSQAIREAFDVARRQLEDYGREQHRSVKTHEPGAGGRVVQLETKLGYGFIQADDGREIYFHHRSVLDRAFEKLKVGSKVRFAEEEGEKGPQASTVVAL